MGEVLVSERQRAHSCLHDVVHDVARSGGVAIEAVTWLSIAEGELALVFTIERAAEFHIVRAVCLFYRFRWGREPANVDRGEIGWRIC